MQKAWTYILIIVAFLKGLFTSPKESHQTAWLLEDSEGFTHAERPTTPTVTEDKPQGFRMRSGASNHSSGVIGVHWHKRYHQWQAQITVDGKVEFLGRFDDLDEAITARREAEAKYADVKRTPPIKSGEKYISWGKQLDKWRVVIPINGKRKSFGSFADLEAAKAVRDDALLDIALSM